MVAKSRTKQLRFGFITVATPEEALCCIKELNGTELKGKKITVELVRLAAFCAAANNASSMLQLFGLLYVTLDAVGNRL